MNRGINIRSLSSNESAISSVSLVVIAVLMSSIGLMTRHLDTQPQQLASTQSESIDLFSQETARQQQTSLQDPSPQNELATRFQQAVYMLHAGQYEDALTALHRVIELDPKMPEAYVNMGFALFGLEKYKAAQGFFEKASDLRPYQGNAYWGMAICLEKLGDLQGALGAMRTYIHLAPPNDPFVTRARSALWEWETTLKRGPMSEQEQQFVKRGEQQWEDRNSPDRDQPDKGDTTIQVHSIN